MPMLRIRQCSRALNASNRSLKLFQRVLDTRSTYNDAAICETKKKHVVVGMSGGVDSSVAALLLKRQGYHVTGVYMKNWDSSDEDGVSACPVDLEYRDVQKVCEQLGIEAQMVNMVQSYWNQVFAPCLKGYEEGLTPNPDILCNREIKFKAFTEYAKRIGADYVATGHYAALRPVELGGLPQLFAAEDSTKDQSYFLSNVDGKAFEKVLFPLGGMRKTQVRQIAESEGLCTASKKDSVGICFIGKRNFPDFIHQYIQRQEGYFHAINGTKLYPHRGFTAYTVGQGARLHGMSAKWFVVGKRKSDYSIFIAQGTRNPALYSDTLYASAAQFNWIAGDLPHDFQHIGRLRCYYRVRYRQDLDACTVSFVSSHDALLNASKFHDWQPELVDDDNLDGKEMTRTYLRVDFDHPQRGVTPDQSLVLYRSDGLCFGGGPIAAAGKTYYEQDRLLPNDAPDWRSQG
ncbi:trna (5-methylaminomethyl-2-thiouridylate)-methyltransferase [Plasmopara halstedii]|uniref:tRNA-5-taurinomethyluridine 2-sulfurtransferase n=1 Tax=Plasmopara halstedii TaxID=4781 RepID=A0A0P1A6N2_PLAHL|nr:trna (5-methylaminomethyl-2-thiouridylate)-methyltransferase [Plasmopara halstedii]CEG35743.1 trna (5-methylaminomethyl-2-thiouridylate)-methyltransferase [Plasmopara halstedii]|eukprot:XP_024572112.1 trna (5-methylaminomethyl-2-thiouridylate)-methyltransferase [Plasmopara halstedii]